MIIPVTVSIGGVILIAIAGVLIYFYKQRIFFSKFRKISVDMEKIQQSGIFVISLDNNDLFTIFYTDIDPNEITFIDKLGSGYIIVHFSF